MSSLPKIGKRTFIPLLSTLVLFLSVFVGVSLVQQQQEVREATAGDFISALVQIIDTSKFSPPSPDPAGITYLPSNNRLLVSDSEVNEMSIFTGVNLFKVTLRGILEETSTTIAFSNEPTGVSYNPTNDHIFISDDNAKEIFEVDPGSDAVYGSSDDIVTSFDTQAFNSNDPEGVAFNSWDGSLYIADGVNTQIYRVSPGANGLFDGISPAGDDQVTSFDTASLGVGDPEGIAFNPDNGNLYIVGKPATNVAEVTTAGTLVQNIDISAAKAKKPAGLAYAPGSVDASQRHLYIVERGVDNNKDPNENDGKIYEMTLPRSGTPIPTPTPTSTPTPAPALPGDIDKDGDVDIFDYNLIIQHFGNTSCGNVADINGDCKVDIFDYNTLIENFGKTSN